MTQGLAETDSKAPPMFAPWGLTLTLPVSGCHGNERWRNVQALWGHVDSCGAD